jgi:hypothetical protein
MEGMKKPRRNGAFTIKPYLMKVSSETKSKLRKIFGIKKSLVETKDGFREIQFSY